MVYGIFIVLVVAGVTQLLRFLPFVLFSRNTPNSILYLGKVLPYSIMAMLVVYCLKNTNVFSYQHGIPELVSVLLVVLIHKWKHNTLISILLGTLCYMFFVQVIF